MSVLAHLFDSSSLPVDVLSQGVDKFGTAGSKVSQRINHLLTRDFALVLLANHVAIKPHVPAVVAIEGLLAKMIGDAAFTDDMKQYTGWRVRLIIEALGGEWVKAGVRINSSVYSTASTYRFPVSPLRPIAHFA